MCYVCVCAVCVLCLVWMGTQKVKATVRYTIVFFLFVFFVFVHRRQAAFQSATQECLDALVSDPSPVCCLVDGLGEALACGVVPQSVERFVGQLGQVIDKTSQSCCVFSANTNGFSANEHDVWQSLAYKADIVLECQALATGSSRDVHGLVRGFLIFFFCFCSVLLSCLHSSCRRCWITRHSTSYRIHRLYSLLTWIMIRYSSVFNA
eukprot:m.208684 g.208684  ORF g.208684 m.208684 type:complete len:207 (-) comp15043_c4_seq4:1562-2182(-)